MTRYRYRHQFAAFPVWPAVRIADENGYRALLADLVEVAADDLFSVEHSASAERERHNSMVFFFSPDSLFVPICEEFGIDLQAAREALLLRLTAKEGGRRHAGNIHQAAVAPRSKAGAPHSRVAGLARV
jgi:hypothetical protein